MKQIPALAILLILSLNLASAVIINSVAVDPLAPGQEGQIRIEVENILDDDAKDVTLTLNFQNLPFIPIGTSEQSIDELEEDEDEDFIFRLKASNEIEPGDYEIPYTLEYEVKDNAKTKTGTIGIKVKANPDLVFSIDTSNPIQNQQGSITLKIVNKGFFDARFVSVRIIPEGFTLLSDDEDYIGEVESDDFETASFDVIFKDTKANFFAIIEYKNFDNEKIIENIELPMTVYTKEKAVELGIIQPNPTSTYIGIAIAIILVIILWRIIKKRRRLKKSMKNKE